MVVDNNKKDIREKAAMLLCLGSWYIYRRLIFDQSLDLVQGALDRGINHFDIADYWDHEMLNTEYFKKIMKELGHPRDTYKIGLRV